MRWIKIYSDVKIFRIVKLCVAFLLAAMTAYLCWPYCLKAPAPDESTFLYEGLLTAQGKLPYRDFFDFIWPGTFYLIALLIKVCGGLSMIVIRIFTIGILLSCGAITLIISSKYLPFRWLCLLGTIFWALHFPTSIQIQHHLMSGFMGVLSVFLLWKTIGKASLSIIYLISSGIALSLCALFTQTLGIILIGLLTGVVFLRLRSIGINALRQQFPIFLGAIFCPLILTFIFLALNQAFSPFFYASSIWLFHGGYVQTSNHWYFFDIYPNLLGFFQNPYPSILDCLNFLLNLFYFLLPILGFGGGIFYGIKILCCSSPNEKDWEFLLLGWASVGFLISTLSHSSIFHLAYNGWIPFMLGACIISTWLKRFPKWEISILTLLFMLFYSNVSRYFKSMDYMMYSLPTVHSYGTLEKKLIWLQNLSDSTNVDRMITDIHRLSTSGENLFVYNLAPEFYILSGRYNPTRYQLLLSVLDTNQQILEAAKSLHQKKPSFILYEHQDERFFLLDPTFKKLRNYDYHLHPIEREIKSEYTLLYKFSHYDLFINKNRLTENMH